MAPEGTSQVIGYGETADFIVYHAKFFEIHWKIIGHIDPTGINLAWDDEVVAPHHTRIYVRPEIIQPRGDPPNDNHYTFSFTPGSAWPNGRCTIHPRGLGADPDPWWLTWTYPAIPGCVKSQDLGVSPYDYPYLYYDRLPNSSGSFGNKTLTLTQNPAGCSHSRTIQLFFDANDAAVNHPGTGTGATPNWYFYWKHTTASWGDPIYATSPAPGITEDDWAWTTWSTTHQAYKAFLWHRSNDLSIPPAGPYRGTNYLGIDTFGFACRHEACHVFWNTSWWPNGPDTGQGGVGVWPTNPEDKDGDLLPDYLEPTLGSSVGGPFYTNQVDSNFDGVDDAEAYTYFKQNLWKTNSAKAQDWSNPGQQSNE
jgi:hypothetical protein